MANGKDVNKERSFWWKTGNFGNWLLTIVLALLLTTPLFILLHRLLPNPVWDIPFDRIALALALIALFIFIFRKIKIIVYIILGLITIALIVTTAMGSYGIDDIFHDYQGLLYGLVNDPQPVEDFASQLKPFPNKMAIKHAIDYDNPKVKQYANAAVRKHFRDEQKGDNRKFVQYCAVFKEINNNWLYINDPKSREYFASASESTTSLSGDCDDHSILMSACIMSIGGNVRLVRTEDHIYPELFVGSRADLDNLHYLIREKLFKEECQGKQLYYHIDDKNQYWLNLDYTGNYPGGEFMPGTVIATLEL